MHKRLTSLTQFLLRSLLLVTLVLGLSFGHSSDALAAMSGGGRIGGGSFRAPSPPITMPRSSVPHPSAPRRTYAPYPAGGGYAPYPSGGFGYPFMMPTFFIGGGGLFTLILFIFLATFLLNSFRRAEMDTIPGTVTSSPTVSVARLQVGLLAGARQLQTDLDALAKRADTGSKSGLAQVLQETTLALLRHPEYWTHANTFVKQARLQAAEVEFNRLTLTERSKFSRETLSNVNNQIQQLPAKPAVTQDGLVVAESAGALSTQSPGEYIVVTLLVAAEGDVKLPVVNSTEELRQALNQLGGVGRDRLMALEVLWAPQASGDVLTAEDLIVEYPNLKLV